MPYAGNFLCCILICHYLSHPLFSWSIWICFVVLVGALNDRLLLASPTEINPRQKKGVEIKSCLVGLLEPILIGFATMQLSFEQKLDLSEILYQITSRFPFLYLWNLTSFLKNTILFLYSWSFYAHFTQKMQFDVNVTSLVKVKKIPIWCKWTVFGAGLKNILLNG